MTSRAHIGFRISEEWKWKKKKVILSFYVMIAISVLRQRILLFLWINTFDYLSRLLLETVISLYIAF